MLSNFVAPYDATVVSNMAAAGMISVGKTNMDEFAMGSSNENSFFGPVSNPWDHERVPGGSSGGSAAAVAAGLVAGATGTDTGGSIRQPAALCGITGLKPTYGRVSRYGMIAFASSLDQAGPMTRDAEDAALMFSVMAGFDPKDSTSAERRDAWLDATIANGIAALDRPLTIGLPSEYFSDNSNLSGIDTAKTELQRLGHKLVEVSLPHTQAAVPVYYVLASAEASTNLSRYDGVRFGHRCNDPQSLQDLYERSREEGFGEEVKRRILTGTYTLSVGYFDAYYLKAQKIRRLISEDFQQAFTKVDVLLAPTSPCTNKICTRCPPALPGCQPYPCRVVSAMACPWACSLSHPPLAKSCSFSSPPNIRGKPTGICGDPEIQHELGSRHWPRDSRSAGH